MRFKDEPDYHYILNLFKSLALKEEIDLDDGRFDWNIKAVAIKKFPQYYDWVKNQDMNPLDKRGKFTFDSPDLSKMEQVQTQNKIYEEAAHYKFDDPK